jgi:predicted ester cyclase
MIVAAFSDRRADHDEYFDTTDGRVVENWTMTATHTGEAFGLPPSGQDVRIRGVEIWRCAGGRIAEHWGVVDMSDVFMKAGPLPG